MTARPIDPARYARQLVLPEIGGAGQQKLSAARVAVVGAGGLGAPLLAYLAAAGVGRVRLIEHDTVSLDNLQRQIIYRTGEVGMGKAIAAKRFIEALNPDCEVEVVEGRLTAEDAGMHLGGCDVIADATDDFATRIAINEAAFRLGVPLVTAAVIGFDAQVAVFDPRDPASPCYRCLYPADPAPEDMPVCAVAGVLGAMAGVAGSWQAMEVVKLLTGAGAGLAGKFLAGKVLAGSLLMIDGLTNTVRTVTISKRPDCPVCG